MIEIFWFPSPIDEQTHIGQLLLSLLEFCGLRLPFARLLLLSLSLCFFLPLFSLPFPLLQPQPGSKLLTLCDGGSLFGVKLKKVARDAPPPLADNASGQLQPAALPASGLALEATRPEAPIAAPEGLQAIERTGDAVVDGQMPPDSLQDDLLEQFGLAAAPMAPALGGTQGVQRDADKVSDDESVGDAGDVQANLQVPLARLTCLVHRNEHWLV